MKTTGDVLEGAKAVPCYGCAASRGCMFLVMAADDIYAKRVETLGEGDYYGAVVYMFGVDLTYRIALTQLLTRDKGK